MLRHCSMPGMSSWSTRRSLHLMVIVPEDPDILHTHTQTYPHTCCYESYKTMETIALCPLHVLTLAVRKVWLADNERRTKSAGVCMCGGRGFLLMTIWRISVSEHRQIREAFTEDKNKLLAGDTQSSVCVEGAAILLANFLLLQCCGQRKQHSRHTVTQIMSNLSLRPALEKRLE